MAHRRENQNHCQILALTFLSVCFSLGLSIGVTIQFGRVQKLNATTIETPAIETPTEIPDSDNNTNQENNPEKIITIKAVGDIIPGTNFPSHRLPKDPDQLLPQTVRAYLTRADIVFGNFESNLTNHPYSSKNINNAQTFAFRSPPSYAKLFANAGFNIFNIANNHTMDFGKIGFQDTIENLNSVGIKTLGHKNQILYVEHQKVKIAMIGFTTYNLYNSVHDLNTAKNLVKQAEKNADIVIVSMQVGAEGTNAMHVKDQTEYFYGENRGNSVQFARKMIDTGADLVLGHGPHVPRAIERYQGKIIAYSLGNFIGYKTLSTTAQTAYSMILEVKLNSQGDLISSKVIPIHINKQGIPQLDPYFRTVGLLKYLNDHDFPKGNITFNQKGQIIDKIPSTIADNN